MQRTTCHTHTHPVVMVAHFTHHVQTSLLFSSLLLYTCVCCTHYTCDFRRSSEIPNLKLMIGIDVRLFFRKGYSWRLVVWLNHVLFYDFVKSHCYRSSNTYKESNLWTQFQHLTGTEQGEWNKKNWAAIFGYATKTSTTSTLLESRRILTHPHTPNNWSNKCPVSNEKSSIQTETKN